DRCAQAKSCRIDGAVNRPREPGSVARHRPGKRLYLDEASTSTVSSMTSPIAQVARMSGVTSRTLRHYDQTGLLPAARIGANGYRYYGQAQLLLLQQILVLRVLGLSLPDIERSQHELTALIHRMAALLAEGAAAGDPRVLDTVAEHYRWVSGYWTPNRDSYPASPRCTSTTSGSRPATRRCGRAGCLHPRCDGGACPAGGSADPPAARPGERTCRGRRPPAWPH